MAMSTVRRERLISRRTRYEQQLDNLYDLLDTMTSNDVQSYSIGSRNISRYKSIGEVEAAIGATEKKLDEIDAELNGHRRKAVAVVIKDW